MSSLPCFWREYASISGQRWSAGCIILTKLFLDSRIWLWKGEKRFKYQSKALDEIVVLTRNDQRLYQERLGVRTSVLYNPLTLETKGQGHALYKKFLAVGRMTPFMKGFDILVEGFALFAQENSEWTLDIVGEGEEEDLIRSLIAKHGLESRVKIHPFTEGHPKVLCRCQRLCAEFPLGKASVWC